MEPQANKKTQEDRKALQTNAVSEFNEYLKRIGVRSLEVTALKDSQWKLSFDKAGKTENLFLAITTPKIENGKIGQVGILISTNEISKENNGISLRELTGSKELREKHSQLIEKINIPELNLIVRNIAKIVGITNLDNLAQASLPKVTNLQILADTINSIPKDTAEVKWINGPYKHGNRILLAIHQIFHDESMDTELCSTTDAKSAMQRLMSAAPKCQNQLEYVIDHLHDKAHLSRFFMENMDSKQAKKYQSIFEQLKKFGPTYEQYQKDFANAGIAANSSEETSILLKSGKFNELKDTLTALRDYQQMREFAKSAKKHEGSLRALESGKISIEGVIGENPTLSFQVKMHSLLNSQGLEQDKHQRLLFDHFVKVAGEQTEHNYAIVICYCHDLKSSVESWNKNNPQNQISLVEIRALEIKKALGK